MGDRDRREFEGVTSSIKQAVFVVSECCQCAFRTFFEADPGSWGINVTSHENPKTALTEEWSEAPGSTV
jgi:hypothetical protein